MIKPDVKITNGVYIGNPINHSFGDTYLKVREKELRIYSDKIVQSLPFTDKNHPQQNEWKLRQKSTNRFLSYLEKNAFDSLLEIGCGNGWFTNQCSKKVETAVGVDINIPELEQAARVFNTSNLQFIHWDIFTSSPFQKKIDLIVLNAVVQYFVDFDLLIKQLSSLLNAKGEIHIVDSPFYENDKIEAAKNRSDTYYKSMSVPEMSNNYFHHSINCIKDFDILYRPESRKIMQFIKGKDMPFGWYRHVVK